ncbi:hypothetical protein [Longispora albida]|uniref:hypothetical protein n=1 Tax=Longispora albida TaxID=203523 RepID=UPI000381B202|nr:hypothetical protein [Longispora albida]
MRVRLAALLLAGAALAATVTAGAPAAADFGDPVNCQQNPSSPTCIVTVTLPGRDGKNGGGGGSGSGECQDPAGTVVPCSIPGRGWLGSDGCYYDGPSSDAPFPKPEGAPAGAWYFRTCTAPWGREQMGYWNYIPDPVQVTPAQLAEQAIARLTLPALTISTSPKVNLPQLVHVPTWIWADASSWKQPQPATASAGGIAVTAIAKPVTMTLTTGDGGTVTCQGPGAAWTPGTDPSAASTSCGHTYTRAGVYTLTATVTWNISWAGGGTSGTAPAMTTSSQVRLTVNESQALNQ